MLSFASDIWKKFNQLSELTEKDISFVRGQWFILGNVCFTLFQWFFNTNAFYTIIVLTASRYPIINVQEK